VQGLVRDARGLADPPPAVPGLPRSRNSTSEARLRLGGKLGAVSDLTKLNLGLHFTGCLGPGPRWLQRRRIEQLQGLRRHNALVIAETPALTAALMPATSAADIGPP
jgi:hypothetical protein